MAKAIKLPEVELLRSLFIYVEGSGALIRKVAVVRGPIGSVAGCLRKDGYLVTSINYKLYLVHRLIWKLVYDEEPEEIDHIDGVRNNNQLTNLRTVSRLENCKNQKRSSANKSGTTGLFWDERRRVWLVYIGTRYLGGFSSYSTAVGVRLEAELANGYHENHGRVMTAQPLLTQKHIRTEVPMPVNIEDLF